MQIQRTPNATFLTTPGAAPGQAASTRAFHKGKVDAFALYESRVAAALDAKARGRIPNADFQKTLTAIHASGGAIAIERVAPLGEELTDVSGKLHTPDDQLIRYLEGGIDSLRTESLQGSPTKMLNAATGAESKVRLLTEFVRGGGSHMPFLLWLPDTGDMAAWNANKKVIVNDTGYPFFDKLQQAYPDVKFFRASDAAAFTKPPVDSFEA